MNTNGEQFDFSKIKDFDVHIDLSIPNYSLLVDIIVSMSKYFVVENSFVYDIGCSTGKLLNTLNVSNQNVSNVNYVGLDIADNLFEKEYQSERLMLVKKDVSADQLKLIECSMVTSIFTLQFLPEKHRQRILNQIYEALLPGGAFVFAEKIYQNTGKVQDVFTFAYYDYKSKSFSMEDIFGKQMKLRSIMKPMNEKDNMKMLGKFSIVESFFQTLHFKAWICIK